MSNNVIKEEGSHPEKEELLVKENFELKELNGKSDKPELKRQVTHDLEQKYRDTPLTDDTTCGWGIFRSSFLQRFANKKAYVAIYGLLGCVLSSTYAYHNSTITTLEKRYKIPSRTIGIIGVGNDVSAMLLSGVISYYTGKGHRPRWIAVGVLVFACYCLLTSLPHFLYGSGQEAISLTLEYGEKFNESMTTQRIEMEQRRILCQNDNSSITECEIADSSLAPVVILFIAQLVSGVGWSIVYTLGTAYLDDNAQRSKTPVLISISFFLRTLGPALGYTLGSLCLKGYISLNLTPTITSADPRWLGAWWLGWLMFGGIFIFFAWLISLFPRELPRAAVRRQIKEEQQLMGEEVEDETQDKPTFSDMLVTFKRLLKNKPYMINNFSSIFYYFGFLAYWIFTPKYIETQYKQSASVASFYTGSVALAFSAIGILASGVVISKFKPSARYLAAWNVFVGFLSIVGIIWYIFLGCEANENSLVVNQPLPGQVTCNSECNCDFVKYSPVCGENGKTYISPCHAGCKDTMLDGDKWMYTECSCIEPGSTPFVTSLANQTFEKTLGTATKNSCPIDCQYEFIMFLAVMCFMKFFGATGRASNFLVSIRCVDDKDKATAMGLGSMMMCLLAFIPGPIFFGALLDSTCILWGRTCSGTGNCWLYDNEQLRLQMNLVAAACVTVGTFLDGGVWFYVKDLAIFDDEVSEHEVEISNTEEEKPTKRP